MPFHAARPAIPFNDDADEPLALRLGRALGSGGLEQRARLRYLGDFSLFTSGFFSDSLSRRAVDVDYYVSMGEFAYGSLSRRDTGHPGRTFSPSFPVNSSRSWTFCPK